MFKKMCIGHNMLNFDLPMTLWQFLVVTLL